MNIYRDDMQREAELWAVSISFWEQYISLLKHAECKRFHISVSVRLWNAAGKDKLSAGTSSWSLPSCCRMFRQYQNWHCTISSEIPAICFSVNRTPVQIIVSCVGYRNAMVFSKVFRKNAGKRPPSTESRREIPNHSKPPDILCGESSVYWWLFPQAGGIHCLQILRDWQVGYC